MMLQDFRTFPEPHRDGTCLSPRLPFPGMDTRHRQDSLLSHIPFPLPRAGDHSVSVPPRSCCLWKDGGVWMTPYPCCMTKLSVVSLAQGPSGLFYFILTLAGRNQGRQSWEGLVRFVFTVLFGWVSSYCSLVSEAAGA